MKKYPLFIGIVCLILAAIIFIYSSGARRIYSGLLFTLIGIVQIFVAFRKPQR